MTKTPEVTYTLSAIGSVWMEKYKSSLNTVGHLNIDTLFLTCHIMKKNPHVIESKQAVML